MRRGGEATSLLSCLRAPSTFDVDPLFSYPAAPQLVAASTDKDKKEELKRKNLEALKKRKEQLEQQR